jgi:predicted O-methyltransferase YrrM
MIKNISKQEICDMLKIPNLEFNNFDLHWTDYQDTSIITNLCYGRSIVLEIGTHLGYTTENIAKNNSSSLICTIDICRDYNLDLKYQNSEILEKSMSGIKIKSGNVKHKIIDSDLFFSKNETMFDVILIDGDHSYDQVKKDTENALRFLNKKGIIIWHDVYNKDNSCDKCLAEPNNDDVAEYLRSIDLVCYKIDKSWVAVYENV